MNKQKKFIIFYLILYILFGISNIYIYKDSKSLIEGGLGSLLYIVDLLFIFFIFLHSRKKLENKIIFRFNIVVLICWVLVLTYVYNYGWWVLN